MCQPIWHLGHTSNKLPFDLMPIGYISKSHLLKMGFDLLLAQWLSQRVCYIVCGVDSFDLDITFFEVIMDQMKSPLDVLGLLVRPWLFS